VLKQAQAFAVAEGIGNVTFQPATRRPTRCGGRLRRGDQQVWVIFFADPVAAFANIGAALRPGDRLVFTTVGPSEGYDLSRIIAAALTDQPVATVHSLADPERIDDVLTRAGFRNVTLVSVETAINLATRITLTAAAQPFETPSGVQLRSTAWLVSATQPQ
jgi:hypothetical protein